MNKNLLRKWQHFASFMLLLLSVQAWGQTPQYYNNSSATSSNAIPLGGGGYATNKCQFLYGPNALNSNGSTGTPAFNGLITTVYFRVNSYTAAVVYSDFTISLIQNVGTSTTFPSTTFGTLTPAFYQSSYSLPTPLSNNWVAIPLQTPFLYDPSLSLIFELKASNSSGGSSTSNGMLTGSGSRLYAGYSATTGTTSTATLVDFGFDLIAATPCSGMPTAGSAVTSNANPCTGSIFTLNLTGNSIGGGQTYQWQSATNASGPWTNIDTAKLYTLQNVTASATAYFRAKVKCGNDSTYSDSVFVTVPTPFPGGTYTIDKSLPTSGTNFNSFSDAISAIGCGIAGPVTFNVATDTFTEQIVIPATVGSNATNTVTFNGNGAVLQSAGTGSNYATIDITGADYIEINNLIVRATGATNGFSLHLSNNSDHNTFDSCTFVSSMTGTGSTACGVVMSGSPTSYSSTGANGSYNTFSYCTVMGGYFGMVFYGASTNGNTNNTITHCNVKDFYVYGIYNYYQASNTITDNIVERPTRTGISTFYGIALSTGCNNTLIERNQVRATAGAAPNTSLTAYNIYVSAAASSGNENKVFNNLIYNNNHDGADYGLYFTSATYIKAYHNTVSIDNPLATTGTVYGIYATGTTSVDLKNNIVSVTRGGTGTKYCLYFSGAGKTSNYNDLYMGSTTGTNSIGYYSGAFATLANWKTANSAAFDQNSVSLDPLFASIGGGNLTPTNSLLDDLGTVTTVTTDFYGAARSVTTPDIGAIEFAVPPCSGTPVAGTATVAGNFTSACVGAPISISLSGFTIGTGISISWESAPAGSGLWSAIGTGGSTLNTTLTGATDFHAIVTCANGGSFDVSNTVSIGVNPFYQCYCSPLTGVTLHTTTSNYITGVSIPTTTLSSTTSAVGAGGYTQLDYTITSNTATLTQGQTYTINAAQSTTYGVEMWVDWDQSGTFDTSEYYLLSTANPATASITVPTTSATGLTGMRLRSYVTTPHGNTGACLSSTAGRETEDYVITIAPGIPCSGIPSTTGVIAASNVSLCNGMTTSFTYSGFPTELGISFQWESSPSGQNNFQPIAGATGFSYTSGSLTASTDYRIAVTCNNTPGGTAYTNIETITVNNPSLTSTTGGTRCGVGAVPLSATAAPGYNINWYASAVGGAALGSGTNFTTPAVSATTTFYAAASSGTGAGPLPEMMYYRFDSPGSTVANEASSPVGNNPAVVTGLTIGGTGQFGTGLQGNAGATASNNVNPGWTGTYNGSWTISFWMNVPTPPTTRYMFGNSSGNGTFRCFIGGAAGGIRLTGGVPSITLDMPNWQPGASVVTYVYNAAAGTVSGYLNGVFQASASPGSSYPLDGNNFVVGSQGTSIEGTMDEFRMYSRALSASEIAATWNGQLGGCEGTRVPVVATVTTPPAYTVSATPDTVCLGSPSTVSINSANNYSYTWTPTGSGSSFSVSPTTTSKYYVSGVDGNNCAIFDSVTVNVKSVPGVVTADATPDAICVSGSTSLTLNPAPMYGIGIEWVKNTGSGYSVIPGANSVNYTEPVSATTYYKANLYCNNNLVATSVPDTVNFYNPSIAQTFPGSRCGTGAVTLAAIGSPSGATVKWYAAATGGVALGTGNAFTTPSISTTTDYYAAPVYGGGGTSTLGLPNRVGSTTNSGYSDIGLMFDASVPFTLSSVAVYPVASTPSGNVTLTIALKNSAGTVLQTLTTAVPTSVSPGVKTVIPLNFAVPAGTGQRLVLTSATGGGITGFIREVTTGFTYPYTVAGVASITSAYTSGASSTYYYYFYDWQISTGCEGTRVPVTATINPAASGTGLATGGTTVGNAQGTGTTVSYTDACNDTVAVVNSGTTNMGATSAIVLTSSTVQTFGGKPFVPRAYDITPATSGPATVTLYALQSEFNAYNSYVNAGSLGLPLLPTGPTDVAGMANIVITQYHGLASAGTQGPLGLYSNTNVDYIPNSSITVTPIGNYWKLTFPVTGFSGFFIHTGATPLSIKLESISATNAGSRNRIDWKTGNEMSGDRFELERSIDGQFIKIADIAAKGQPSGYSYWDETPVTGMNYYRLKMIEASGRYSYSQTVQAIVKSGSFTVSAYPNPVREQLTVKVYGTLDKDASVTITDVTGKVVRRVTMDQAQVQISMNGLAQGMYLIKYTDASHSQTIRVTKE